MQATANGPKDRTDWNSVDWRRTNRTVRNLRGRIFRATQRKDWRRVNSLQKLMLRCRANRLQAVRRVTQVNQGKRTPGVDKVLVKTPTARGTLVDELGAYQPWRAKPTKRVYIPKANGKQRPLGIPTICDRALQAMVKNALEPSWEARFEATSYGFRPGRSCHDALGYLHTLLNGGEKRQWVVDADIEGAFDNINHEFLLKTIGPVPGRELIRQWLKAGFVEEGDWHPTETGTPQGGVISPLLANIALHGMEEALGVRRVKQREGFKVASAMAVVRYADDFVVVCHSKEEALGAIDRLTPWLAQRGLRLSEEKTRVVHIQDGFDFLGLNLRQYATPGSSKSGVKLLIKPSRDSVRRIRQRLRGEWHNLRSREISEALARLNPIIRGWANYFRPFVSAKTFSALDDWMNHRTRRYVWRKHPNKPKKWLRRKYWGRMHPQRKDNWVFGDKATGGYLLQFAWFKIQRHVMVKGTASPDNPELKAYWEKRNERRALQLSPSRQRIARSQGYNCQICGESLFNGEDLHVHHQQGRSKGGKDNYENLVYRHLYCHQQIHATKRHELTGN